MTVEEVVADVEAEEAKTPTYGEWVSTNPLKCDCERCYYCDCALASRHEHDHFPVPKRYGGEATVPVCLNCHDLKDRIPLSHWPPAAKGELFHEIMAKSPPLVRIYIAQMSMMLLDKYELAQRA